MMAKLLSLEEIGHLEKTYELGAASLGTAFHALRDRWHGNLRDSETFIRLAFLNWYSRSEPGELTGLDFAEENAIETLIEEAGTVGNLGPECKFILGALASLFPESMGREDKWSGQSSELLRQAAVEDPKSLVFRNWRYLLNIEQEPQDPRTHIKPELYARFHGRGYMGTYLLHMLGGRVGL